MILDGILIKKEKKAQSIEYRALLHFQNAVTRILGNHMVLLKHSLTIPPLTRESLTCQGCPGKLYCLLHEPQPSNSCWQSCLSPNHPLIWTTNKQMWELIKILQLSSFLHNSAYLFILDVATHEMFKRYMIDKQLRHSFFRHTKTIIAHCETVLVKMFTCQN